MIEAPRPTRAEATDVANLVLDGCDGILLGAETWVGRDPPGTAKTVLDIARQARPLPPLASIMHGRCFWGVRIAALAPGNVPGHRARWIPLGTSGVGKSRCHDRKTTHASSPCCHLVCYSSAAAGERTPGVAG